MEEMHRTSPPSLRRAGASGAKKAGSKSAKCNIPANSTGRIENHDYARHKAVKATAVRYEGTQWRLEATPILAGCWQTNQEKGGKVKKSPIIFNINSNIKPRFTPSTTKCSTATISAYSCGTRSNNIKTNNHEVGNNNGNEMFNSSDVPATKSPTHWRQGWV